MTGEELGTGDAAVRALREKLQEMDENREALLVRIGTHRDRVVQLEAQLDVHDAAVFQISSALSALVSR